MKKLMALALTTLLVFPTQAAQAFVAELRMTQSISLMPGVLAIADRAEP